MKDAIRIEVPPSLVRRLLWFRERDDEDLVDVIRRLAEEHAANLPQNHPDWGRLLPASQTLHMWMVMFIVDHYPRTATWVTRRELAFGAPSKFAAITSMGLRMPSLSMVVRGTPDDHRDRRHWLRERRAGWSGFTLTDPDDLDYAWYLVRQAHRAVRRAEVRRHLRYQIESTESVA